MDYASITSFAVELLIYILLTGGIWFIFGRRALRRRDRVVIGLIYGLYAVLCAHFGTSDGYFYFAPVALSPLIAGLYFDPLSAVIAGVVTAADCCISQFFWNTMNIPAASGITAVLMTLVLLLFRRQLVRDHRPPLIITLFLGALAEVILLSLILFLNQSSMELAYIIVEAVATMLVCGAALSLGTCTLMLKLLRREPFHIFHRPDSATMPITRRFHYWLLLVMMAVFLFNQAMSVFTQTRLAEENAQRTLRFWCTDIAYGLSDYKGSYDDFFGQYNIGLIDMEFLLLGEQGIEAPLYRDANIPDQLLWKIRQAAGHSTLTLTLEGGMQGIVYAYPVPESDSMYVLGVMYADSVYSHRNQHLLEETFSDIILFTVIYIAVSLLIEKLISRNLERVNGSLNRIIQGQLDETVNVRSSREFSVLSDDINRTVDALKGYIDAAEKRIEQELLLARTIQEAALPKNFNFRISAFDLYALMDPAREVGGDFYDFFYVDPTHLALVIADVSGKGIPAAMFMMRAKTAIRSQAESGSAPAEIFRRTNELLCEGNDAEMFVTAWIGIIDLRTGLMRCANAGHEYPLLRRAGGGWELMKDKHSLALAAMEGVPMKEYELTLQPGDSLFVYTDGAPEAIDRQTEQYGLDRLIQTLNQQGVCPMSELLPAVHQDIFSFVGDAEQFDDITMLGFTWNGIQPRTLNGAAQ